MRTIKSRMMLWAWHKRNREQEKCIQYFSWKCSVNGRIISNETSINLWHSRLDLVGTEQGLVAGYCEHGNAACGFMKNWRKQRVIQIEVIFIDIYALYTIISPFCSSITSLSHRTSRPKCWYFISVFEKYWTEQAIECAIKSWSSYSFMVFVTVHPR